MSSRNLSSLGLLVLSSALALVVPSIATAAGPVIAVPVIDDRDPRRTFHRP